MLPRPPTKGCAKSPAAFSAFPCCVKGRYSCRPSGRGQLKRCSPPRARSSRRTAVPRREWQGITETSLCSLVVLCASRQFAFCLWPFFVSFVSVMDPSFCSSGPKPPPARPGDMNVVLNGVAHHAVHRRACRPFNRHPQTPQIQPFRLWMRTCCQPGLRSPGLPCVHARARYKGPGITARADDGRRARRVPSPPCGVCW